MWDVSSPTRDQTHSLCTGRQSLNHWATEEAPILWLFNNNSAEFECCFIRPKVCCFVLSWGNRHLLLNMSPITFYFCIYVPFFRLFVRWEHWGIGDAEEAAFSLYRPWGPCWLFQPCSGSANPRVWLMAGGVCLALGLNIHRSLGSWFCWLHRISIEGIVFLLAGLLRLMNVTPCGSCVLICEATLGQLGWKVLFSQVVCLTLRKLRVHGRIISQWLIPFTVHFGQNFKNTNHKNNILAYNDCSWLC